MCEDGPQLVTGASQVSPGRPRMGPARSAAASGLLTPVPVLWLLWPLSLWLLWPLSLDDVPDECDLCCVEG